ncbi:MAG: RCC1 domain-containing protein, partial [Cyanobacteriota bacterium]
MSPSALSFRRLELLLPEWKELLQGWALEGAIGRAAAEALQLEGTPPPLRALVSRWAEGDFSELPAIVLLSSADINGALGAYAISTGTIYLNADWLETAPPQQAVAVLTEELGHHLDGLLNAADTPGDVGQIFANLLTNPGVSVAELQALRLQKDAGTVVVQGQTIAVEQATITSAPIRASYPGRTNREYRNCYAFAALKSDGSVVTWGEPRSGGSSSIAIYIPTTNTFSYTSIASQLSSGVTQIFSNQGAFAALKADGSVVTWGDGGTGGNSSGVAGQLSSGVTQIYSNYYAFAALKADGSVITWGSSTQGGDSSGVASKISSGVTEIFSKDYAFAALKADGSVVTWGDLDFGGNSSGVASRLSSGVTQIFSTGRSFAALKADGSVVTWGEPREGGSSSVALPGDPYRYQSISGQISSGVAQIFSNGSAYVALKNDRSVVTWGHASYGGTTSGAAAPRLTSGVREIFATEGAFAALKSDGSVVTWGDAGSGGINLGGGQISSGVIKVFSSSS